LTVLGKGNKICVLHVGDAALKAVWNYLCDLPDHTTLNIMMKYGHLAQVDIAAQHGQYPRGN
jgi:hypothetical protein